MFLSGSGSKTLGEREGKDRGSPPCASRKMSEGIGILHVYLQLMMQREKNEEGEKGGKKRKKSERGKGTGNKGKMEGRREKEK